MNELYKLRKRLEHKLERATKHLRYYEDMDYKNLSTAGGESLGYFKGKITCLEDRIDDINDIIDEIERTANR